MSTERTLDRALQVLRDNGRDVEPAMTSLEGGMVIPIDGIPRTVDEVQKMAERLDHNRD